MWDDIRYRWALRKHLKEYRQMKRVYAENTFPNPPLSDEPDYQRIQDRELMFQEMQIDGFRSKYLEEQALLYHVPLPEGEGAWIQPRYASGPYLTPKAAQQLRADIRTEQKADWDFWTSRVTLALALVGSIFGVLAFFKK